MTKKVKPPVGILKEKQPEKELTIEGMMGYKITMSKKNYNVMYDVTNENNLMFLIGAEGVLIDMEEGIKVQNVYTTAAKKDKRDRLEKNRKLQLECKKCITELVDYLIDTKDQAHYDLISDTIHGRKKKTILTATTEDVKKIGFDLIKP